MSRLLWVAAGAGVTLYVTFKVRGYLSMASPESLGHRVAGSLTSAREQARDFADRVRAAMAESEAEIRESLGLPS